MDEITIILCGIKAEVPDHEHKFDGPWVKVKSSFGEIDSSTCSICGKAAFNEREIW